MAAPSSGPRRIASLLPAATETLFVLGAWERVVAVSHECDFPPETADVARVTRSLLGEAKTGAEIDAAVKRLSAQGGSTLGVDAEKLASLKPDLVVVQEDCDVCALTPKALEATLKTFKPRPEVFAYHAHTYEQVLREIRKLGEAVQRPEETKAEILKQWSLAKQIRGITQGRPKVRVAVLDWIDPPMFAGHWTKELVEMAGGEYGLVASGQPSRAASWKELIDYAPDVILATPCGLGLERAADELAAAVRKNQLWDLAPVAHGRLWVADGNRYFNRPGPRLVYSAAIAARALHPDHVPELPPVLESGLARMEVPRSASGPRTPEKR